MLTYLSIACNLMDSAVGSQSERPGKRQRLEDEPASAAENEHAAADAPLPPPPAHNQISAALAKLANHLANKNKFSKASQLLRQLLDAVDKVGALTPGCTVLHR